MVIQNTCLNLSNIVHTDFELDRVIQTVVAVDPGITEIKVLTTIDNLGNMPNDNRINVDIIPDDHAVCA